MAHSKVDDISPQETYDPSIDILEYSNVPQEDRSWKLVAYNGDIAVTPERASQAAHGEKEQGYGNPGNVETFLWTYGRGIFTAEALDANPQLKERGYPKDLPVYVVEFTEYPSIIGDQQILTNYYILIDANTGYALLSYAGDIWNM